MYVTELVAAGTVNTCPQPPCAAFADHGEVTGNTITGRYHDARRVLDQLAEPRRRLQRRHRTTRARRPRQVREQLERAEPHHRRRTASQPPGQAILTPALATDLNEPGLQVGAGTHEPAHHRGDRHWAAAEFGPAKSRWRRVPTGGAVTRAGPPVQPHVRSAVGQRADGRLPDLPVARQRVPGGRRAVVRGRAVARLRGPRGRRRDPGLPARCWLSRADKGRAGYGWLMMRVAARIRSSSS